MKHTDDEIVAYARSRIRHVDQQKGKRLVLAFVGAGGITLLVLLVHMILEKSEKEGGGFFQDARFISGFGFGIFCVWVLGISVVGFLRAFATLYGKDIEVCRLLVKLNDEKK